jgi:hypothetical protein
MAPDAARRLVEGHWFLWRVTYVRLLRGFWLVRSWVGGVVAITGDAPGSLEILQIDP